MAIVNHKDRIVLSINTLSRERVKQSVQETADSVGLYRVGWPVVMIEGVSFLNNFINPVILDIRLGDDADTVRRILHQVPANKVKFITISPFISLSGLTEVIKNAPTTAHICMTTPSVMMDAADFEYIGVLDKQKIEETTNKIVLAAQARGVDAVLCKPEEVRSLRKQVRADTLIIAYEVKAVGSLVYDGGKLNVNDSLKNGDNSSWSSIYFGADYITIGDLANSANNPKQILTQVEERVKVGLEARLEERTSPVEMAAGNWTKEQVEHFKAKIT